MALTGLVALAAVLAYLPMTEAPPSVWRSAVKTVPLLCFAVIAVLAGGPILLTLALILSALGDLALSRAGARAFLAGVAAFAAAHLAYIALFLVAGAQAPPLGAVAVILLLLLSTEFWLMPHAKGLAWPIRVYAVILSAMALAALGLPEAMTRATWGALLFLASDLLLAVSMFRAPSNAAMRRGLGRAVWLSYTGGQAAILWAFALPSPGLTD